MRSLTSHAPPKWNAKGRCSFRCASSCSLGCHPLPPPQVTVGWPCSGVLGDVVPFDCAVARLILPCCWTTVLRPGQGGQSPAPCTQDARDAPWEPGRGWGAAPGRRRPSTSFSCRCFCESREGNTEYEDVKTTELGRGAVILTVKWASLDFHFTFSGHNSFFTSVLQQHASIFISKNLCQNQQESTKY